LNNWTFLSGEPKSLAKIPFYWIIRLEVSARSFIRNQPYRIRGRGQTRRVSAITLTKEIFDGLLEWLDSDPEVAGRKYETIRAGLIRIFISKGFADAEDLADETFNRISRKLPDIGPNIGGEYDKKIAYCRGVAHNIKLEAWRRKEIATDKIPERITRPANTSHKYDCLLECLKSLPDRQRDLILDYYLYEGKEKIEFHRRMAEELEISVGALRLRAHHTRRDLEKCVLHCAKNLMTKQNTF
jgi:DNA-directed RNA polymerase specialized sigma24 family protein